MAAAMRLQVLLSIAVVLLVAGTAGASASGSEPSATASAYGVKVVPGASSTAVSAPPNAVGFTSGFAYPSDGSIVTTGSISASASTDVGANARSTASSAVSSFSLFHGEVTASNVTAHATGSTSGQAASGSLSGSSVSGLTVNGAGASAGPNGRVQLGDWGYAITLEQSEARSASGKPQSYRGFLTGLDIHLTADHGGLAAGSEILVGYAEASVQAGAPEPVQPTTPTTTTTPKQPPKAPPKPSTQGLPPNFRPLPVGLQPQLTAGPYVFPVYGPHSFIDTFGAFRGDVSGDWHHGDDIFASLGAPVLACADGAIFSVGWNDVGGNRLWLRDGQGNEYYYAHLSAYSPAARNGNHVKAGEVIGFVGNTGDAEGTAYHLHFEVHPVAYLALGYDGAVDPTPYLKAWQEQKDLYLAQVAGYLPGVTGTAPKPGAILLQASDISQASGLDPASLRRAFFAPLLAAEDGRLVRVATPPRG
jgi:Peptidase family M23